MNMSTINLNNDLNKIKNWAIQWKMNFNPDPSKQAQEVIFSRKLQKTNHNQVYFNHIEIIIHYLLQRPNYLDEKRTLLDNLQSFGEKIHNKNNSQISELLLFGFSSKNDASNTCILNATIQYIWLLKDLMSLLESFEVFTFFSTYANTTVSNKSSYKI